ncbi:EAL domain-containing protein [Pseudanabaena sp. FACHB-2040]|uniref:EAL domain-containing protein n=1 Tax=Pseudanabaena sp. FACHB-2040 TaxID=2692859 RepID=UPI0016834F79|nr:EAL domain-containing protein [Pseudanabaena sp. FACHB-2040]MBD2257414.1 EAL domain-containing protein [Pseudanabaena sp. FACHB-2040]
MTSTVAASGAGVTQERSIPPNLHLQSTLDALTLHRVALEITEPGQCVIELFDHYPLLPGLILKRAGLFFGVLSRQRFYELMGRPFSLELFARRSLATICHCVDVRAWSLSVSTPIVAAARQALRREAESFYEPIAVEVPDQGICLLDIHELFQAQALIHELAVDALKESQYALMAEKELAQITLQSIGDGVITTDASGKIQSLNRIAEQLTGWTQQQARGLNLYQVFTCFDEATGQTQPPLLKGLPLIDQPQAVAMTGRLIDREQQERIIDYSTSPICDAQGGIHGVVLVLRDITHQRRLARQLHWQASHDALTGLTNRNEFERLLQEITQQPPTKAVQHTLCYLDLDRFKIVNDTCGHLAGDELLRQISALLQSQVRGSDVVARLGGDEFGILLYDCSLDQGTAISEVIRHEIQQFRFLWEGQSFTIGASIGITTIDGALPPTEVLRQGDLACYWAKHEGRNRVCQFQEVEGDHSSEFGMVWVSRLTQALDQGGFCLYQQKVVDPWGKDQPLHSELLLRLVDRDNTLHLPNAFLPTAERYSLMPDIDRWVIRHAFKAFGQRQAISVANLSEGAADQPLSRFAINLSGASLNDNRLVEFIQTEMAARAVAPQQVCFEITETVAIANLTRASAIIHALKQLGCHFALDDFGCGMSALTSLKTLPVDFLKIDGSFIRDITTDAVAFVMVKSIHEVARVMGLKTIAEWVDNEATLNTLRGIGIDYVQGYFIDQPQSIEA